MQDPRPAPVWVAAAATGAGVLVGFLVKLQCVINPWADNFQYTRLCYNDIQPLFIARGIDRGLLPYIDVTYEFPPLTGWFMHLVGRLLDLFATMSNENYFLLTALLLAPLAFIVTMLTRPHVSSSRLLLWAVGAPIVLYSFVSWDLLAVAPVIWGIVALTRGRDIQGGIALAIGATAKLYGVFLLPVVLAARWFSGDRRGAYRILGAFSIVALALNVPVMLMARGVPPVLGNPRWADLTAGVPLRDPTSNGWFDIWRFHADRSPEFDTAWFWIAHHGRALFPSAWWDSAYPRVVDAISLFAFLAAVGVLVYLVSRRSSAAGQFPLAASALGVLAAFLVTSKVYSPQYGLWIAPLFALVAVPWRLVFTFFATDVAVFVSRFYFFSVIDDPGIWRTAFEVSVLARLVVLLLMLRWVITEIHLEANPEPAEIAVAV